MRYIAVVAAALVLVGCPRAQNAPRRAVRVEFRLGEEKPAEGLTEMAVPGSGRKIYLHSRSELAASDIAAASVRKGQLGLEIEIIFTEAGRERFAKVTRENVEKHLAILVDGKAISAPRIKAPITGGRAVIHGQFSQEGAQRIAGALRGK